jgi:DNA-binding XRE family transcriptional regulator
MIANEREYRITKAAAKKFEAALKNFDERPTADRSAHPRLMQAEKEGMAGQLATLRRELREYERLRSGRVRISLREVEQLPKKLVRARIAAGLTQEALAKKLGIKRQQIQRYEGSEYASASLATIRQVAQAIESAATPPRPTGRQRQAA